MKLTLSMLLVIQPTAFVVPHPVRIDYFTITLEFTRSETANINATLSPGVLPIAFCLIVDPGTLNLYLFWGLRVRVGPIKIFNKFCFTKLGP